MKKRGNRSLDSFLKPLLRGGGGHYSRLSPSMEQATYLFSIKMRLCSSHHGGLSKHALKFNARPPDFPKAPYWRWQGAWSWSVERKTAKRGDKT